MFERFWKSNEQKCSEELFAGIKYVLSLEEDNPLCTRPDIKSYLESISGYDDQRFSAILPGVLLFAIHDQLVRQFESQSDIVVNHLMQLMCTSYSTFTLSVRDALAKAAIDAMYEGQLNKEEGLRGSVPYCVGKTMAILVTGSERLDLSTFMAKQFLFYFEAAARLVSDIGKKYLG